MVRDKKNNVLMYSWCVISFFQMFPPSKDKNRRELSQMAAKINLEALVEQRMQMRRPSLSDLVGGRGGPTGASSTHKRLNDHAEKAVVHTPYVAPATVRRQVLRDAHIVATTLSGAGSKVTYTFEASVEVLETDLIFRITRFIRHLSRI
jgi:hypothetical protein